MPNSTTWELIPLRYSPTGLTPDTSLPCPIHFSLTDAARRRVLAAAELPTFMRCDAQYRVLLGTPTVPDEVVDVAYAHPFVLRRVAAEESAA